MRRSLTYPAPRAVRLHSARRATGALLAICAGVLTIAADVFPFIPSVWATAAPFIMLVAQIPIGVAYIFSAFLADWHVNWARLLLVVAAIGQLALAFTLGHAVNGPGNPFGPVLGVFDIAPIILALLAAIFVTPARIGEEADVR